MTAAKDDLSRVNIGEERSVRYWTETLDCSKDELAAAVAKVGESPLAVRREVNKLGHTGHSRLAQKRRHDSDEHQDGCASMREGPRAQGRANGLPFPLSLTGCEGELDDHY